MRQEPPVVVAGMHRSGTSLVTSLLAAMGLELGRDLLPADSNNRRGYFEHRGFLELNRRLVAACCDPEDGGHPDWGWTERESFDAARLVAFQDDGRRLLEAVGAHQGPWGFRPWGFKDPRNTLLLDYWDRLLEDARFVLLYRHPWDVADSMQRLGAEVFLRHPDYAPRIWSFYNRHLLDFYRRHRERCVLASTHAVLERPQAFAELVIGKLGLELDAASLDVVYEPSLLHNLPVDDPLPRLFAATYPQTLRWLGSLESEADLPTTPSAAAAAGEALRPHRFALHRFAPTPEAPEPQVSVVIPCRDLGHLLIEAIASVERSIPEPYELIVVDDGSTQAGTVEILDLLAGAGYRIERQEAKGVCAARNKGFELTRAPYVIPLDSDNRLRPGPFLEAAIIELEADPSLGVVYGDRHEFGLRRGHRASGDFDLRRILGGNYIDTCAVIRRTTWNDAGGYDEELPTWEDWELWIRVARRGWKFRHLDQVAFDYRVRPGSLVTAAEDPDVLGAILDRVVTSHREVFEHHLVEQLGHSLASWPFLLLEQRNRLRGLRPSAEQIEIGGDGSLSARSAAHSGAWNGDTFELARSRLAALEAAREADSANWRLEHAKTSARHFEESARQLRDTLAARNEVVKLQQTALGDLRSRAELAEKAYGHVKTESLAREQKLTQQQTALEDLRSRAELSEKAYDNVKAESLAREQKLRRLDLARQKAIREAEGLRMEVARLAAADRRRRELEQALAEIESSQGRLLRLWRRLAGKLRPGRANPSRLEDGAYGG